MKSLGAGWRLFRFHVLRNRLVLQACHSQFSQLLGRLNSKSRSSGPRLSTWWYSPIALMGMSQKVGRITYRSPDSITQIGIIEYTAAILHDMDAYINSRPDGHMLRSSRSNNLKRFDSFVNLLQLCFTKVHIGSTEVLERAGLGRRSRQGNNVRS